MIECEVQSESTRDRLWKQFRKGLCQYDHSSSLDFLSYTICCNLHFHIGYDFILCFVWIQLKNYIIYLLIFKVYVGLAHVLLSLFLLLQMRLFLQLYFCLAIIYREQCRPHEPTEILRCSLFELRSVVSIKCAPDFEDMKKREMEPQRTRTEET